MEVIKEVLCIKGDGLWIKKGLKYNVVHSDDPYRYRLAIKYKNLELYPYYNKSRFKDLQDV